MKRMYVILAVVVVLFLVAGAGVYWYAFLRTHIDISSAKPAYSLSSTQLLSEFTDDETAANEKYAGEIIEVEGKIVEVIKGERQTAVVLEDRLAGISVYLDSSFVANNPEPVNLLDADQSVTFRGQCDGMLTDIIISRAVIVK